MVEMGVIAAHTIRAAFRPHYVTRVRRRPRARYALCLYHAAYYIVITCLYHTAYYIVITCLYYTAYYIVITCLYHAAYYIVITCLYNTAYYIVIPARAQALSGVRSRRRDGGGGGGGRLPGQHMGRRAYT